MKNAGASLLHFLNFSFTVLFLKYYLVPPNYREL